MIWKIENMQEERENRRHASPNIRRSAAELVSETWHNFVGEPCHNHTMKRVGCDPHIMASKATSLKRHPSGHMRANIEECHDAIEEDDAPSNTLPRKVGIEDKLRHNKTKTLE